MKKSIVLAGTLLFGIAGVAHSYYYENSTPHNQTNAIECANCHAAPAWGDPAGSKPYLLNTVGQTGGTDCLTCHINENGKGYSQFSAPMVGTHGSQLVGEQYGKWSFNCWDCHQNHDDPPANPAVVTGSVNGMQPFGDQLVFTVASYTVYDLTATPPVANPCVDTGGNVNLTWCDAGEWMKKTHVQSPYDPVADGASPAAPEFTNGPCDSAGTAYDPNYDCTVGVKDGERGLMLWVTLASGTRAGFEVVDAAPGSPVQITVKGTIPAGDSFSVSPSSPKPFELQYGMLVKNTVATFGFCTPDPVYNYCFDAAASEYTAECVTGADCANGETCEPRSMATKCITSADCPTSEVCEMQAMPAANVGGALWTGAVTFGDPGKLAYDESWTGIDPTPNGICQVCHTRTVVWKADGTGANHNNGAVCTKCHLHTAGFMPANCAACHGKYPTDTDMPISYINPETGSIDGSTGSVTAGAHAKHAGEYRLGCQNCHANGMPLTPIYDKVIQMGFAVDGYSGAGTAYYGQDTVQPTATNAGATLFKYQGTNGTEIIYSDDPRWTAGKEMSCENVYCHSQGKRKIQGFDLPSRTNAWNSGTSDIQGDGFTCNNCHGFYPTFDSHRYHAVRKFGCELCHSTTVAKTEKTVNQGYEVINKKNHANGAFDVAAGGQFYSRKEYHDLSFVYAPVPAELEGTGLGGECSSNSCHAYFNFKDPKRWTNRTQRIANATLTVTQGNCTIPPAGQQNASSTISISVQPSCSECVGPYTCDFNWGDGTVSNDVACDGTTHTYLDKIPSPYDPDGSVIGGYDVSWTIRDSFNVTLDAPAESRVEVCPKPNVLPTVDKQIYLGPDVNAYDLCLKDTSVDPDYNIGSHWGGIDPGTGQDIIVPGAISIDWGFVPEYGSTYQEFPLTLTNTPSNAVYCFVYPRRNYYNITHQIKDNAADAQWIRSPITRIKVTLN